MAINNIKIQSLLARLSSPITTKVLHHQLSSKFHKSPPALKFSRKLSEQYIQRNWKILRQYTNLTEQDQQIVADPSTMEYIDRFAQNIENCIGSIKIPVGVAGPLRINGLFANNDYYIPLATTEAALVASYHRGSRLITAAGGCATLIHDDAVTRSPGFVFNSLAEVGEFTLWMSEQTDSIAQVAESTTRHGKLFDITVTIEGNHVYLNLDYYTGQASGQNMVTIATAAVVTWILEHTPVQPVRSFVEANRSGDKKASALSFTTVRGKKVSAEVLLSAELIEQYLHTTPSAMAEYWQMAAIGSVLSGTMGIQGHFANALAALYIATGQDAACVSESSVGITRLEVVDDNALYATVTLPNIMVGTVGGGTSLPSQRAGLNMLNLTGDSQAHALAEICAALCLSGELSIIGALSAGHFARAHAKLARGTK